MASYTEISNTRIPINLSKYLDRTFSVSPSKSSITRMAFSSSSASTGFFTPDECARLQRIREARVEREQLYAKYEAEADKQEALQRVINDIDETWDIVVRLPDSDRKAVVVQSFQSLLYPYLEEIAEQGLVVNHLMDRICIVNKIIDGY
ncbi:hypothetical protein OROMI_017304 [Orobanche minor]